MKKSIILLSAVAFLFSCQSENSRKVENNKTSTISNDGRTYDCLVQYEGAYSKLLSSDELLSIVGMSSDDRVEVELKDGKAGESLATWPSDRPEFKIQVGSREVPQKDDNKIRLHDYTVYNRKMDLSKIADGYNKSFKELAVKVNSGKDKSYKSFQQVERVGTDAWYGWEENEGGKLHVLAGRTKFTIDIKVHQDAEINKSVAMELASIILSKCN